MRSVALLVLVAFVLRLVLGAGAVLCVHADGDARLEWTGATCCGGECELGEETSGRSEATSRDCDCQDHRLSLPPALKPQAPAQLQVPAVTALASTLERVELPRALGSSAPRVDVVDPGRPRAVATTVLRF